MENRDNKGLVPGGGERLPVQRGEWRFPAGGFLEWLEELVGGWRPRVWVLVRVLYWLLVGVGRLVWGLVVLLLLLVAAVVCLVASVLPE